MICVLPSRKWEGLFPSSSAELLAVAGPWSCGGNGAHLQCAQQRPNSLITSPLAAGSSLDTLSATADRKSSQCSEVPLYCNTGGEGDFTQGAATSRSTAAFLRSAAAAAAVVAAATSCSATTACTSAFCSAPGSDS